MNFMLAAILIVIFGAFASIANAVEQNAMAVESGAQGDFPYFWSKCVCIFNSVDKSMNESSMDDLWHTMRVQMTAIVNVEWNICTKLTDINERHKCKAIVIGHGVQVITKLVNELVFDHKLDLDWLHKLHNNMTTECFQKAATRTFIEKSMKKKRKT